ncbi:MAG TPA: hypothetical protein DC054_14670 [Blastocatellia bacterium]|nr:hypothetical protein [Blastocatellia bacterium]
MPETKTKPVDDQPEMQESFNAAAAESLFVLLPLIVLTIVLLRKGNGARGLFGSPEWSFAGAILLGQSIIKVIYAISSIRTRKYKLEFIVLVVAGAMVLGLAPSPIVLSIMLTSETPSLGMISLQLALFAIGLTVFLVVGMLAHFIRAMGKWQDEKQLFRATPNKSLDASGTT